MKKIIVFTILPFALFLLNSCVKLKETPEGTLSPATFYRTEADFNAAVSGMFAGIFGGYSAFDAPNTLCLGGGADDVGLITWDDNYARFDRLSPTSTLPFLESVWKPLYSSINNANSLIKNIGNAKGLSQEKLNEFEGQARFIRAFCYFYLTRFWGKIPIVTEFNQSAPEDIEESSALDISNFIVDDLKIAEEKLAVSYPERGLATKGAAKTLLAQVYLTMTGWPVKDASYYPLARDKAKEVMDMNTYQLEPNFADLWLVANKLTNKEAIFTFFGSSKYSWVEGSHYHVETRPGAENGWAGIFTELPFYNSFPEGPRKDVTFHTVFTDGSTWEDDLNKVPYIGKFRDAGAAAGQNTIAFTFDGDGFIVPLRYAEVLLIYAEAANMAEGSPSGAAQAAINEVRERAGLDPLPTDLTKEAFDKAVFDERGWELAFECGSRWFDLVRKEKVVEVNKDVYPEVDAHNMLLPKPAKELDLIPGLHQNDGY